MTLYMSQAVYDIYTNIERKKNEIIFIFSDYSEEDWSFGAGNPWLH